MTANEYLAAMPIKISKSLNPETLAKIRPLELRAKMALEGLLSGKHASPFHGFSAEFAQYRAYNVGDDLRNLDWKAYGKSDRLVIKQHQDETNTQVYLLLDSSKSMAYQGNHCAFTKMDYAKVLLAALAILANRQHDAIGLAWGAHSINGSMPPASSQAHLSEIFKQLEKIEAIGETDLAALYKGVSMGLKSGSLCYVVSDCWQSSQQIITGLKSIHFRRQALSMLHLLSPDETNFLSKENCELEDIETHLKFKLPARFFADQYRHSLKEHCSSLRKALNDQGIRYTQASTDMPFEQTLKQWLHWA